MRRKCIDCLSIALVLLLVLSAVFAGPVLGEVGKKATLHEELEDMLFIGDVGISTEYLFADQAGAGQRINDALMDDTYDGKAFVKLSEQPLVNIWERQEASAHDLAELADKLKGYWDGDGEWVVWEPDEIPPIDDSPDDPPITSIIYEGVGDDIITIEKPKGVTKTIAFIQGNQEARHFAITGYDAANNYVSLLVNTTDPYEGIIPLDLTGEGEIARLEIKATGSWLIEVRSLYSARIAEAPGIIDGSGHEVILVEGELDTAFITGNEASRHFAVIGHGEGWYLLVNTTEPYEGRVLVPSDINVIEIKAVGEWGIVFE